MEMNPNPSRPRRSDRYASPAPEAAPQPAAPSTGAPSPVQQAMQQARRTQGTPMPYPYPAGQTQPAASAQNPQISGPTAQPLPQGRPDQGYAPSSAPQSGQPLYPPQPRSMRSPETFQPMSPVYRPPTQLPVQGRPMYPQPNPYGQPLPQRNYPQYPAPQGAYSPMGTPGAPAQPRPQRSPQASASAAKKKRKPVNWLPWVLVLLVLAVMALLSAQLLMKNYLHQQEEIRQAQFEQVLFNYHITRSGDGYRITWQDEIEQYARDNNLQPAFVAAVIDTESDFRADVTSSKGAKGLMQLMPGTASDVAGWLNDDTYTEDSMFEAERNIRYGCRYLRYLSQKFRGDPILIACAYHAGHGNVEHWLSNASYSPDGVTLTLDRIPMEDSKKYARRITTAYGIYQALLYPSDGSGAGALDLPLPAER